MNAGFAKLIYDHDPDGSMTLRDDYSGRGMYGKTTHAIVAECDHDMEMAIQSAFEDDPEAFEAEGIDIDVEDIDVEDIFRTDNMGMRYVYY